jgi:hypothetical protein
MGRLLSQCPQQGGLGDYPTDEGWELQSRFVLQVDSTELLVTLYACTSM